MAIENLDEGTIFDKLGHLDMQLKEAEQLHWSAATAYDTAVKDGVNVKESMAILLETAQAITKIKAEKIKIVKDIDDLAKKDPRFMEQINETISACDIAMLVSMEHFTKTCVATNDLRPIVYDRRKGKISLVTEQISSEEATLYAAGITKRHMLQWCPTCGSSRIFDYVNGVVKVTPEGKETYYQDATGLITGQVWTCLDCGALWKVDYRTGKAENIPPRSAITEK